MANPVLAEVQARQAIQSLRQLTGQVKSFTAHANLLRKAKSFALDPRLMLEEANKLLQHLIRSRADFQKINLTGFLSSRPPAGGGMSPAAKWRPELTAGSKQFADAVREAEKAIQFLYNDANAKINLPTRTAGPDGGWFEALLSICEALARLVEYCKQSKR